MRLIDADKARENSTIDLITHFLDRQPTIDAEPVRHSFWEEYETGSFGGYKDGEAVWWKRKFFRCERCRNGSAIKWKYCPICGAEMDGDSHA